MNYDPSKVAFVDTETTGLDPEQHVVWEYAVIVDGIEQSWQARLSVHHQALTDPWVLDNTGIAARYNEAAAMPPLDAAECFARLVRGRHLVGACPWFDSERIHRSLLSRLHTERSLPWHYHLIDVETLIVGYVRGQRSAEHRGFDYPDVDLPWDSRELSRLVGVNPDDFAPAHTALADARWAKACFEAVMGGPA